MSISVYLPGTVHLGLLRYGFLPAGSGTVKLGATFGGSGSAPGVSGSSVVPVGEDGSTVVSNSEHGSSSGGGRSATGSRRIRFRATEPGVPHSLRRRRKIIAALKLLRPESAETERGVSIQKARRKRRHDYSARRQLISLIQTAYR